MLGWGFSECNKVKHLGEELKKKYGQALIGKYLGQFHVDFDMFDADGGRIEVSTDIN